MFAPTNQGLGFFLAVIATICWGSWPSARVNCNAEAPVFVILYLVGQLCTAVFFCLTLGMIRASNSSFDQTSFLDVLLLGSDGRKLIVTLGGFCYGNSDFIFAIVCSKLSFAVGFPIYAGTELILGTLLNYAILGSTANLQLQFMGLLVAFCAILCMAVADKFDQSTADREPGDDINNSVAAGGMPLNNSVYSPLTIDTVESSPHKNRSFKVNSWVLACFAAGCLSGSWSPLSSLGRSGRWVYTDQLICLSPLNLCILLN